MKKGTIEMKSKQKAEAIKRMRKLGIIEDAIKQFQESDTVMISEGGFLYWLSDDQKEMVKQFEEDNGCLAYMVIHSLTEFGELFSILYVSQYEEEWKMDNEDLEDGIAMSYVINADCEWCSEFGCIGIRNKFGGLVRTA